MRYRKYSVLRNVLSAVLICTAAGTAAFMPLEAIMTVMKRWMSLFRIKSMPISVTAFQSVLTSAVKIVQQMPLQKRGTHLTAFLGV